MTSIIQSVTVIGWITFAVTLLAYFILAIDIKKFNGIKQSFFTWFMWGILDSILFVNTMEEKGSDLPILGGCVVGSFSISILLFSKKKKIWKKEDNQILALIFITAIIWVFSNDPIVAIISAIISEIIAGIPLMRASWRKPGSLYNLVSYIFFLLSYIFSLIDAPNWSIENILFPLAFLIYSFGDTTPLIIKWTIKRKKILKERRRKNKKVAE